MTIDTRPIAGTRPRRGHSDAAAIAELTGSPKEQAEHVMLIDLERNDLGRLCEAGTVRVDEFMVVESYAHVHHIVSNVSGRLRPDVEPGDVIRALFPGGTITGCPKVRCMQLIGELEGIGRGAYTGAMGYLALDGSLDLNILIRTMTVQDGAGRTARRRRHRRGLGTRARAGGDAREGEGPVARARQRAMTRVLVNGRAGAAVDPLDRGLLYGDGLFETLAFVAGRPRFLDWHFERLVDGTRALGFPRTGSRRAARGHRAKLRPSPAVS